MTFIGESPESARAQGAARLVAVWLMVTAVWLAFTWVAWMLAGSLTLAEEEGSPGDGTRSFLLAESAAVVATGAAAAALLPGARRGARFARLALAWLMIGLTAGHLLTLMLAAFGLLFPLVLGFYEGPGGGDPGSSMIVASVVVVALDAALVVLTLVVAIRLFRVGTR